MNVQKSPIVKHLGLVRSPGRIMERQLDVIFQGSNEDFTEHTNLNLNFANTLVGIFFKRVEKMTRKRFLYIYCSLC